MCEKVGSTVCFCGCGQNEIFTILIQYIFLPIYSDTGRRMRSLSQVYRIPIGDQGLQTTDQKPRTDSQMKEHQADSQTNDQEYHTLSQVSDQDHQIDTQSKDQEPQASSSTHGGEEITGPLSADGDEEEHTPVKDGNMKLQSDESEQGPTTAQEMNEKLPAACESSAQQPGTDPSERPTVSHESTVNPLPCCV